MSECLIDIKEEFKAVPRGGKRRGAGRPLGSRDTRPSAKLVELARERDGVIPVKIEGDSRAVLQKQMNGEVWLSREQIYAAKALLPIEYPPAVTYDGRSVEEIEAEAVRKYLAAQPDTTEALVNAINALRDVDEEQQKPPQQVLPPPLPRPRVRPRPEAPVIDQPQSPQQGCNMDENTQPNQTLSVRLADLQSPSPDPAPDGGKSDPEPVPEISAEETAVVSALPPHLMPARWRRN